MSEVISTIVTSYRSLKLVSIDIRFESSAVILRVAEYCRKLEELVVGGKLKLERSDFESIASIPRLKFLQHNGVVTDAEAVMPLAQCTRLKELYLWMSYADLESVLSVIGIKLKGLSLNRMDEEGVNGIVENYHNSIDVFQKAT